MPLFKKSILLIVLYFWILYFWVSFFLYFQVTSLLLKDNMYLFCLPGENISRLKNASTLLIKCVSNWIYHFPALPLKTSPTPDFFLSSLFSQLPKLQNHDGCSLLTFRISNSHIFSLQLSFPSISFLQAHWSSLALPPFIFIYSILFCSRYTLWLALGCMPWVTWRWIT